MMGHSQIMDISICYWHPYNCFAFQSLALERYINAQPRIENVSRQSFLESQNQVPLEFLRVHFWQPL